MKQAIFDIVMTSESSNMNLLNGKKINEKTEVDD